MTYLPVSPLPNPPGDNIMLADKKCLPAASLHTTVNYVLSQHVDRVTFQTILVRIEDGGPIFDMVRDILFWAGL